MCPDQLQGVPVSLLPKIMRQGDSLSRLFYAVSSFGALLFSTHIQLNATTQKASYDSRYLNGVSDAKTKNGHMACPLTGSH